MCSTPVLRDYLLYAADQEIISIAWSGKILAEVTAHLIENIPAFDTTAGVRLARAMNSAYPYADARPTEVNHARLAEVDLPDENDRHVLAAAIAAEATVLCTSNVSDFPHHVVVELGVEVLSPDELLSQLIIEYEAEMLAAHRIAVASLRGASDESTVQALRRAQAPRTAAMMASLLGID
jgi:predicted nucleic acid-binding protein